MTERSSLAMVAALVAAGCGSKGPNVTAGTGRCVQCLRGLGLPLGGEPAPLSGGRRGVVESNMGLTSWTGGAVPRKADVGLAKNYLAAEELEALNRIVTV